MTRIFTHGGKAHADEVLAAALLIAARPDLNFTEIIRDEERLDEATKNDFILMGANADGILSGVAEAFAPCLLNDEQFGSLIENIRSQKASENPGYEEKSGESFQYYLSECLVRSYERRPLMVAEELSIGFKERLAEIEEEQVVENWLKAHIHIEWRRLVIKVIVCEGSPYEEGFSKRACDKVLDKYLNDNNEVFVFYGWDSDGSGKRTLQVSKAGEDSFDFTKARPDYVVFCRKDIVVFKPADENEYKHLIDCAAGFVGNDENGEKFIVDFEGWSVFIKDWVLTLNDEYNVEV